ncbi:MAG: DUF6807 family protein [Verrucomicrobiota bacterium]
MKHHLSLIALLVLTSNHNVQAKSKITELENSISLELGDQLVWKFNHDPAEGKPYFHPLATAEGVDFTALRPEDHPWHRGMWFSWKYIDGVNYWEENRQTGLSQGHTRLISNTRKVLDAHGVHIRQVLEYAPDEEDKAVLREQRTIELSPPDNDGSYTIDWTSRFDALKPEVVLDRTPVPGEEGGKGYGGYAGLSIRMNAAMKQGRFINRAGQVGREGHGKASPWVLYQNARVGSILFMDHPGNLRHPVPWYIAGMPYFSPAPLFKEQYILKQAAPLSLRYRVVVSSGNITSDQAANLYAQWSVARAKVLIVTGANNHNWKATTPEKRALLEAVGFEVDVEVQPETLTAEKLAEYDVLLSNWNAFGKNKPAPWPEEVKRAYVEFVRKGGGHIVVHAGSSSYYDWDEYHQICLATWGKGVDGYTGHKEHHEFPVRMTAPGHPVVRGIQEFKTFDELWFRPQVHPDAEVLAEAYSKTMKRWEPVAFAGNFGKGRCFTIMLGHDVPKMRNEGFQQLFRQGAEWVAGIE